VQPLVKPPLTNVGALCNDAVCSLIGHLLNLLSCSLCGKFVEYFLLPAAMMMMLVMMLVMVVVVMEMVDSCSGSS